MNREETLPNKTSQQEATDSEYTPAALSGLSAPAREEYWASLALRHCPGLGARTITKLLNYFHSACKTCDGIEIWRKIGISERCVANFKSNSWVEGAKKEWDQAQKSSSSILLWASAAFPENLREISDTPALLYCSGDISLLKNACIGIVGSRNPTQGNMAIASNFAASLSQSGVTVVSGMAQGIDRAAHIGALEGIGTSIGVLGTGIEIEYPHSNRDIFALMRREGLLISEFSPMAAPIASNFPIRNRIISGLSLGVLVVEAAIRSGSLITARLALEQDRNVFAVPGAPLDDSSEGCKNLIRQGAIPVFASEDILRDLAGQLGEFGIKTAADDPFKPQVPKRVLPPVQPVSSPQDKIISKEHEEAALNLTGKDLSEKILACLTSEGALHIDQLLELTESSQGELSAALIGMEMLGRIRLLPGSRYEVCR